MLWLILPHTTIMRILEYIMPVMVFFLSVNMGKGIVDTCSFIFPFCLGSIAHNQIIINISFYIEQKIMENINICWSNQWIFHNVIPNTI